MKFNFRKIASVIASAVMLGSTVGVAAAASYPAPFVTSGTANAAVVITSGTHVGAFSDFQAALSLQSGLQNLVSSGSGGSASVSTSGENFAAFTSGSALWINDSVNNVKTIFTKTELPTLLAQGTFSGNVEATYQQTISLGSNPQLIFAKQPTTSDDPTLGYSVSTNTATYIYNATVTFNKAVNFSHADSKNQEITMFGKKFTVGSGTDVSNLVLFKEATSVSLDSSGSTSQEVTVGGNQYTVELVSASTSTATVKVTNAAGTSDSKEVSEGYSKKINGLTVAVSTADSNNLKYAASITAGAEKYTLTAGSSVSQGDEDTSIDGTLVTFTGSAANPSGLTGITVSVAAKDSDHDALLPGGNFDDPVFGNFKVSFPQLSIADDSATNREEIKVYSSGDDKMYVSLTDYNGNNKAFQWAYNKTSGIALDVDDSGHTIRVSEMAAANKSDYIVIGNEQEGHLLKVTRINNATTSYTSDEVSFQDVFSGDTYKAVLSADGAGTLTVAGRSYDVKYYGAQTLTEDARTVRLNYPDSSTGTMIAYPTFSTSKGAKVAFYKPLTINATSWDGIGGSLSNVKIPNGNGYQTITVVGGVGALEMNMTIDGTQLNATLNPTKNITLSNTGLTFQFRADSVLNQTTLSLLNPQGSAALTDPALIIWEEKDDNSRYEAIVVTLEGSGTSTDGTGVNDVVRSWSADATWDSITLASDSKKTKEADLWGTIALVDSSDSDQKIATISYPDEQINGLVYLAASDAVLTPGEGAGSGNGGVVQVVNDVDVDTVKDKNLVVVGGSCINTVAAKILGGALCGAEFTTKTKAGVGQYLIKTVKTSEAVTGGAENKFAILVAGYEAADTKNAVAKLKEGHSTDVGEAVYPVVG